VIFIDTGIWFARFVPQDPNHNRVTAWFEGNDKPLVTSDYCVDETLTLLATRERPRLAIQVGRELFEETIARLNVLSSQQIIRAWILFQRHAYAGWSFTDCTSKVIIEDLGLKVAAALDQHFREFGIDVLP
jgi:uncharacterized protein